MVLYYTSYYMVVYYTSYWYYILYIIRIYILDILHSDTQYVFIYPRICVCPYLSEEQQTHETVKKKHMKRM